jgi:hypothetical protein
LMQRVLDAYTNLQEFDVSTIRSPSTQTTRIRKRDSSSSSSLLDSDQVRKRFRFLFDPLLISENGQELQYIEQTHDVLRVCVQGKENECYIRNI